MGAALLRGMSNTASNSVPAPLNAEETPRAVATAEKAVYDGLMQYAEDPSTADLDIGEATGNESYAYFSKKDGGKEVEVYAEGGGLYLCVTVKLNGDLTVKDSGVDKAMEESAAEAASDAYTSMVEGGYASAWE
jgi:hypothetical protein